MTTNPIPEVPGEQPPVNTAVGVYFNGFNVIFLPSDVSIVLMNSNSVVMVVQTNHQVAKSLGKGLLELTTRFENAVGQKVMTVDEVNETLEKKKP